MGIAFCPCLDLGRLSESSARTPTYMHFLVRLPLPQMFLCQKKMVRACNLAGKPVMITRVVDTMTGRTLAIGPLYIKN